MRRGLVFFIFALNLFASTPVLNLNGIYFYDVKEVLNYSNPDDTRKILLIFSSQQCSYCTSLKMKFAALDNNTKQLLSARYIFSIVEDDAQIHRLFKITSTPTTFVMTQNKKFVVAPMIGEPIDMDNFVNYLFEVSKN